MLYGMDASCVTIPFVRRVVKVVTSSLTICGGEGGLKMMNLDEHYSGIPKIISH